MYQNIFLKSLYPIFLAAVLENFVSKRNSIKLWQSGSPVKQVSVFRKLRGLLVIMK